MTGALIYENDLWSALEAKSYVQKAKPPDRLGENDRRDQGAEYEESVQCDTMHIAFCGTL